MKIILNFIIIIAVIASVELGPPKGNCAKDEVNRCIMGSCTSTLVYCPPVFEDGKLVSDGCNKTNCDWSCTCVKKEKANGENLY
jgi:hypothetical protein